MEEVLRIEDLRTYFFTDEGVARAVDGVSLSVAKEENPRACGRVGLRQVDHGPLHLEARAGASRQDSRRPHHARGQRDTHRCRRSRCATSGESSRP